MTNTYKLSPEHLAIVSRLALLKDQATDLLVGCALEEEDRQLKREILKGLMLLDEQVKEELGI